ncbi:MAG: radical SAM protein [Oscillospiraceae bacterium]|nr:radical SAM protein [Oscillospiraceae bacterium]
MNNAQDASMTAAYWDPIDSKTVRCGLCPHRCIIPSGAAGRCRMRENQDGRLVASGYGLVSSIALDPIEKKPLNMFHPGTMILSIGGFGCNLRCPFCQNYEISTEYGDFRSYARHISSEDVARLAVQTVSDGNIGVAYTYNEPLIGYEFVYDCAKKVHEAGLFNVLVTNGFINEEPLNELAPYIDAMNIDLKAFSQDFYDMVGGTLEEVKRTIAAATKFCHVEVTTLVIPNGSNSGGHADSNAGGRRAGASGREAGAGGRGVGADSTQMASAGGGLAEASQMPSNEDDIEELSKWLVSIDPAIPLHLSRFFPRYMMSGAEPTPRETVIRLRDIARKHLKNVFTGNM